jgi:ribosome biogenesis GTPase / thiamine phosphate phosphatase
VRVALVLSRSPVSRLESLGFGPFFSSQLSPEERAALRPGRVVAGAGPRLLVAFDDGDRFVGVPGRLCGGPDGPAIGDFLLVAPGAGLAVRILARRTRFSRNASGRATAEQVLAANVDLVLVVHGLDAGPNPRRLERTVAAVHAGGAEPVVVLTKPDLAADRAAALREAAAAAPGARVLLASGVTGEGVEALAHLLAPGLTAVLSGPSGAGKSTLVNALVGEAAQATGEVREEDRRGRHVTTARTLFPLPRGGAIIDGPGIRELRLWDAAGIPAAFEDVNALAAGCRFRDCAHAGEPGCAVRAAVDEGQLDEGRLASLQKLAREAAAQEARRSGAAARAEKQRWRGIARAARRLHRERGR